MPPGNGGQDLAVLQGALFQPGIHKPFVTQGQRFVPGGTVSAKIHNLCFGKYTFGNNL